MTSTDALPKPNDEQSDYWNGQLGWVERAAEMDATLSPVLDLVLGQAKIPTGARVLDIGCGTGASTERIAQIVGAQGHVTGIDISKPFLAAARTRLAQTPRVDLIAADAQTDPLPQGHTHAISRFGVMFFADNKQAFRNLARALIPGAPFTMAAWSLAEHNPYFMQAAKAAARVLGSPPPTDRSAPGPFAWENPDPILADLRAAGLEDVRVSTHDIHLTPPGGLNRFADLAMTIGPATRIVQHYEASAEAQSNVHDSIVDLFTEFLSDDGLRIPAQIHIYHARTTSN